MGESRAIALSCTCKPYVNSVTLEYEDETITACWFSYSAIKKLDAHMLQLVKEYAQMHEALAA